MLQDGITLGQYLWQAENKQITGDRINKEGNQHLDHVNKHRESDRIEP